MKNYGLKSHKLGDKIVLDGIEAINLLQRENKLPGFISGGMAVSSYLPIENHRETIDLDYTLLFGGGVGNYKQISEPLVKSLTEKGYFIEYKKKGTTHDYFIKCNEDSFLIQHPRRSYNNFMKNQAMLYGIIGLLAGGLLTILFVSNTVNNNNFGMMQMMRIRQDYAVLSPEDIVIHKLNRALKFHVEYNVAFPKNIPQEDFKKQIESLKEEVLNLKDSVTPKMVARLRLFYDVFDIKSLGKSIGLNKVYFEEALKDWFNQETGADNFRKTLDRYEIRLD